MQKSKTKGKTMGYSTDFTGVIRFKGDITVSQLSVIKSFLGEDCRDHPEWKRTDLTHIDLKLEDDFSGLSWDGSEKTYDLVDKINLITTRMRTRYPEFGFTGELLAQGQDIKDRWILCFDDDGMAMRKDIALSGDVVSCPDCGCKFIVNPKEERPPDDL